ncbi:hypothetical protein BN190_3680015 [Clostridioides difficile T14]|nr:hypothetical protein QIO_3339 [Clostridioides difficile DA00129]CCL15453.1 hypothetical protein BN170_2240045 [Clostridioides difficile T22]CCL19453.1 hypothetical protein BN171_3150016 [Clostridioides difficile E25]CCL23397.1 hypothetical protein BN172_4400016 [Clostridioides difficile T15]CCL27291.1 hypothetical protein BN173_2750017 [Clostridioides difficile T11]CCL54392.1 hypothetical protein BN180_2130027 [Clostridioides difficile E14]CCL58537.1 hypothetical protein BN181_3590016 [Clo
MPEIILIQNEKNVISGCITRVIIVENINALMDVPKSCS